MIFMVPVRLKSGKLIQIIAFQVSEKKQNEQKIRYFLR